MTREKTNAIETKRGEKVISLLKILGMGGNFNHYFEIGYLAVLHVPD